MNRNLFLVLLIVASVALVAPSLREVRSGDARPAAEPQAGATTRPAQLDWYSGGKALDRSSDGHFYADALVEGAPVNFMVDTGASVIALTAADAESAGLTWDEGQIRQIGQGASGPVYGLPVRLGQVEIGGIVVRDVDAVIVPQGLGVSLLGQSFLSKLSNVSIEGNAMMLGPVGQ
ncbi:MAG: TIGR02281 family clan AA aspartic protease [Sphingomonadales bacterium]|nr:TIGR02281 family clan AA aspartic protease [Sphingomonadales bacterium]MBD3772950.1 TIGR02281 family clan AA aspartic protease [Paracoccaceae bacterium]